MIDWKNLDDNYLKELSEATQELESRLSEADRNIDDLKSQLVFAIGQDADDREIIELLEDARAEQRFTYAELLEKTVVRQLLKHSRAESAVVYFSSPPLENLLRSYVHQNLTSPQRPESTRIPDSWDMESHWIDYMLHDGASCRADVYLVRNLSSKVMGCDALRYALGALKEQQARKTHAEQHIQRETHNMPSTVRVLGYDGSPKLIARGPLYSVRGLEVIDAMHGEMRNRYLQERMRTQLADTLYSWARRPMALLKN